MSTILKEDCVCRVEECDLVVLLVASRRGWVPSPEEGGDGERSITVLERDAALRRGIQVRVLLARESWPGSLWENDQPARDQMSRFRAGLNRVARFFVAEGFDARAAQAGSLAGELPFPAPCRRLISL